MGGLTSFQTTSMQWGGADHFGLDGDLRRVPGEGHFSKIHVVWQFSMVSRHQNVAPDVTVTQAL
jgi:hypothetical protein